MGKFERPDWDEYFMLMVKMVGLRSNCITRKVGAVIVRDNRILGTGYNGTPSGFKNCFDGGCQRCQDKIDGKIKSGEDLDRCACEHAEPNALMYCARVGVSTENATVVIPMLPCRNCAKLLITAGIIKIICGGAYAEDSKDLLKEAKIEVVYINTDKIYSKWLPKS